MQPFRSISKTCIEDGLFEWLETNYTWDRIRKTWSVFLGCVTFPCQRSCVEVWWVMTGYSKPIWFNGCVLLYSWEKGQIPCAFGRGVMKVGAAHLSHYLKQARRLLLPAGKQMRPGSGYCATGRLLFPLPISGDSEILFYPVSERRVTFVTCLH